MEVLELKKGFSLVTILLQRFYNKDLEFLQNNTITHIVNCSAKEFPCHHTKRDIRYLDLNWSESQSEEVLKLNEKYMPAIEEFITGAEELCEAVLVFCSNGQNRALCIIAAFLMRRSYNKILLVFL